MSWQEDRTWRYSGLENWIFLFWPHNGTLGSNMSSPSGINRQFLLGEKPGMKQQMPQDKDEGRWQSSMGSWVRTGMQQEWMLLFQRWMDALTVLWRWTGFENGTAKEVTGENPVACHSWAGKRDPDLEFRGQFFPPILIFTLCHLPTASWIRSVAL